MNSLFHYKRIGITSSWGLKNLLLIARDMTVISLAFFYGGEAGIRTLVTLRVNSISSAAQSTTLSPLRDKGVDSLNAY